MKLTASNDVVPPGQNKFNAATAAARTYEIIKRHVAISIWTIIGRRNVQVDIMKGGKTWVEKNR